MHDTLPPIPKPRTPRWKRLLLRGIVLGIGLAVAAIGLEAFALRVDPYGISYYRETNRYLNEAIELLPEAARPDGRIFENRPGAAVTYRAFDFRVNQAGLRSHKVDDGFVAARDEAAPAHLRILFLGDSVTLGWGVDDEDTWVRTIEREAVAIDGRPVECLNGGHLQYNTIQEADWLAAHGPALRPDLVVLTYVVNDLDDAYGMYLAFRAAAEASQAAERNPLERLGLWWRNTFRGTMGLVEFLRTRWDVRTRDEEDELPPEEHPGYAEGWARSRAALDRMATTCEELGAQLLVLDHTTPRFEDVRGWCEANAVPWYDLTFTAEEAAQDIHNSVADAHANALGNRFLADCALGALVDAGHVAVGGEKGR